MFRASSSKSSSSPSSTKGKATAKPGSGSSSGRLSATSVRLQRQLVDLIRNGEIAAGERLDQRQLSRRLRTTTAPLREALSALENQGLLIRKKGMGVFCRIHTVAEVEEMVEIRGVLEALAARRAISHLNDEMIAELRAAAKKLGEPIKPGGERGFVEQHIAFHKRIIEISRSPRLQSMLEFHHFIDDVLANIAPLLWKVEAHDHLGLVEALASGDPDRAERAMRDHIAPTYKERFAGLRARFGEGQILPPSAEGSGY